MTLRQKQSMFISMLARLILYAESLGYELTMGRGYVSPAANKAEGGHPRSTHLYKLAIDLNLFKNGKYLSSTKSHESLGIYWESMGGTWGGRFNDGNHYSIEHNGVK
jgi:hypothetical protein